MRGFSLSKRGTVIIVLLAGLMVALEVGHASALGCLSPEEYRYGSITGINVPETVKTDFWFTTSLKATNNGKCKTLYRSYAEFPIDIIPRWSFPDYFWLEPGETTTVEMKMWTGALPGSGTVKVILESHYGVVTTVVDSKTKTITITEESPSIEEQIEGAVDAVTNELDEVLARAINDFGRSPLSKFGDVHFALHFVGKNAAYEDMQSAVEAQQYEIRIAENAADAIAIAAGHAVAGAGEAVSQAVCALQHFKGTALGTIRRDVTQVLLKNDIVDDSYTGEKKNSYVSVYLGGPVANNKMISVNDRMKRLNLPYFDGNDLITPDGKVYNWGYGVYAIVPDVNPASIQSDGSFVLTIDEINQRIERGDSRLYYVVASGTNREGTVAAEKAYLETLAVAEEMTEIIKKGLCSGDLGEDDLYLLGNVLNGHAQTHSTGALEHPESLDLAVEFTQSLILLGNNNLNKEMKLRPIALIVKAVGDSWTPVGVYYGK